MWLRSSLSVATVGNADPAGAGARGALALRVRIQDDADWRLNKPFLACADAKLKSALDALPPPPEPGTSTVTSPAVAPRPDYASCLDEVAWNADQAAFAAAGTFASTSSALSDTRADGFVAWFGASRGIGKHVQLVGNLKYHYYRAIPAAAALHQASVALRGEYKAKYFGVAADAGYGPAFQSGNVSHRGLFGIVAHVRVAETSYAEVGLQDDLDWSAGTGKLSITSNFKLSFAIPR